MMFNCFKCLMIPPSKLIKYNFQEEYKKEIWIDACLADEIQSLWDVGIHTTGCCCGHGIDDGFIQVIDDDMEKMMELGYEHYIYQDDKNRKDAFIPKTKNHVHHGFTDSYLG